MFLKNSPEISVSISLLLCDEVHADQRPGNIVGSSSRKLCVLCLCPVKAFPFGKGVAQGMSGNVSRHNRIRQLLSTVHSNTAHGKYLGAEQTGFNFFSVFFFLQLLPNSSPFSEISEVIQTPYYRFRFLS